MPLQNSCKTFVRSLRRDLLVASVVAFAALDVMAQGGWVRDVGGGYVRAAAQTVNARTFYRADGVKVDSAMSVHEFMLYGEVGLFDRCMLITSVPMLRFATYADHSTAMGMGDVSVGLRYAVMRGDWPVSVGVAVDLPTGDAGALSRSDTGGPSRLAPLGDGETNLWLSVGASRSFWPTKAYASVDVAYNVRGLSASDVVKTFDNGQFSDQYRVMLKGGLVLTDDLWLNLALYRLGTVGTPRYERFSFLGLGEGVEYDAWDVGLAYTVDAWSVALNGTGVFRQPRAVYGGATLILGVGYTW